MDSGHLFSRRASKSGNELAGIPPQLRAGMLVTPAELPIDLNEPLRDSFAETPHQTRCGPQGPLHTPSMAVCSCRRTRGSGGPAEGVPHGAGAVGLGATGPRGGTCGAQSPSPHPSNCSAWPACWRRREVWRGPPSPRWKATEPDDDGPTHIYRPARPGHPPPRPIWDDLTGASRPVPCSSNEHSPL